MQQGEMKGWETIIQPATVTRFEKSSGEITNSKPLAKYELSAGCGTGSCFC